MSQISTVANILSLISIRLSRTILFLAFRIMERPPEPLALLVWFSLLLRSGFFTRSFLLGFLGRLSGGGLSLKVALELEGTRAKLKKGLCKYKLSEEVKIRLFHLNLSDWKLNMTQKTQ